MAHGARAPGRVRRGDWGRIGPTAHVVLSAAPTIANGGLAGGESESTLKRSQSLGSIRAAYAPLVAACCLLAAALRLYKLADANPWWDEGFTYWLASQDVPGMLLRTAGDTHPPLSYLLYQLWMPLAGRAIFALRFQAVLFGVLAVPVCAGAARRMAGPAAGLLAALLIATSPFHVWWSQQIRMYALVALLCSLSMYFLLKVLAQHSALSTLAALFVTNVAGLYTLYFFAVLVLFEGLLVLGLLAARRRVWPLLVSLALTPLPLAPWLAYFRQHSIHFADSTPPLSWLQFLQASWAELTLGIDTGTQTYGPLLIALAVAAVAVITAAVLVRPQHPAPSTQHPGPAPSTQHPGPAIWLALVAAGLPLAAYAITLQRGLFFSAAYQTRYDLPALPALLILLAWGIVRAPRVLGGLALALFLAGAVAGLVNLYPERHRTDDYQSLARFVEAYGRPGDAIVFDPDWNFHLFLLDYHGGLPWEAIPLHQPVDAAYADQIFSRWSAQYAGLWLLQESGGHDAGAQHPVRDWLQAHLRPALQLTVGDRRLTLYDRPGAEPRSLNAGFTPEVRLDMPDGLRGYDQPIEDVRPGDVLHLTVYSPNAQGLELAFAGRTFSGTASPGSAHFAVPIGADTPSGRQRILVRLPSRGSIPLGSAQVEAGPAPMLLDQPSLAHVVGRDFGGLAQLTSYDLEPAKPEPGRDLTVRLQWRALSPFAQNYTVFVHVLDAASHVVAQRDSQPQNGQLPTVLWQPGQVLNDAHTMSLPPSLPPGPYQLEVGLYLQATAQRLPADNEDRLLFPLEVVKVPSPSAEGEG